MSEHTPLPWREWDVMTRAGKDEYPEPHVGDIRLVGSNDICIGVVFGGYSSLPECEANAAFIVNVVNNQEALVKALRDAKAFMIIEQLSPAVHSFEVEKRDVFRKRLFDQIDTAILGAVGGSGK